MEGVIIKKSRIQNDSILITDYIKVSISAITQWVTKDLKLANIATALGEAALYDRFNIQATVNPISHIDNWWMWQTRDGCKNSSWTWQNGLRESESIFTTYR